MKSSCPCVLGAFCSHVGPYLGWNCLCPSEFCFSRACGPLIISVFSCLRNLLGEYWILGPGTLHFTLVVACDRWINVDKIQLRVEGSGGNVGPG